MEQKYKLLLKNVGYLTISNFASRILVFMLMPLYTSVLSTEEYGSYDVVVTTIQIIAPVVIANISDSVMRFSLDDTNNKTTVINIGYKFVIIGIFIIGTLLTANRFLFRLSFFNGYEIYAFLYALAYILNSHFTQYAKGINKVSVMAVAGVMSTVFMLVLNILFLLVFKLGIFGFFLANILSLGIPAIYYMIKLRVFSDIDISYISKPMQREMLLYSIPLLFNTIGWTINSSLDKYCIIYFYGVAASGILAVAYKIPTILSTIYAIFTQAWQISAVTEYNSQDRNKFYSDTFLLVNTFGSLCCAGLLITNRLLAGFLFQNDFYDAWKYVPFLLLSAMFNQTAGFVGPLLSAKKESKAMAKAAIWGSISNLIFNIAFIILLGIQGAAVATAISSFVIYFVRWWCARDLLNNDIYKYLYSTWLLLLIGCIAEVFKINYAVHTVIFVLLIIVNRSQINKVAKKLVERIKR